MRVDYHPLAVSDLNEAVEYNNQQRFELGDQLRSEVYAAIGRVCANPNLFPVVEFGVRRCLVHRFPYSVLFRVIDEDAVLILVIRHQRRHPGFGLDRR